MNPKEYHLSQLKTLQNELIVINKRKKTLVEAIKDKIKEIESLEEPVIKPINNNVGLLARDMDLCIDFLSGQKNKVPSKILVDYLNTELKHQSVRWMIKKGNKEISSADFMMKIGNHLKEQFGVGYCTENYPGTNRKTTMWFIK